MSGHDRFSYLPLELFEGIIGHLQVDDWRRLSLVCVRFKVQIDSHIHRLLNMLPATESNWILGHLCFHNETVLLRRLLLYLVPANSPSPLRPRTLNDWNVFLSIHVDKWNPNCPYTLPVIQNILNLSESSQDIVANELFRSGNPPTVAAMFGRIQSLVVLISDGRAPFLPSLYAAVRWEMGNGVKDGDFLPAPLPRRRDTSIVATWFIPRYNPTSNRDWLNNARHDARNGPRHTGIVQVAMERNDIPADCKRIILCLNELAQFWCTGGKTIILNCCLAVPSSFRAGHILRRLLSVMRGQGSGFLSVAIVYLSYGFVWTFQEAFSPRRRFQIVHHVLIVWLEECGQLFQQRIATQDRTQAGNLESWLEMATSGRPREIWDSFFEDDVPADEDGVQHVLRRLM